MAGNPLIQAANNWFNNTIRNGGQKEAPGSASNNTIAAAATTQQTPASPAQTTPSRSNTQTGKKKDDDRRSQSAGASALQEAISTGDTTPKVKSIEQTNVAKGLNSKAGIYDVGINIEASQSVTPTRPPNYVSIEQRREFFDASGGLRLDGAKDARQLFETQTDKAIKQDPIMGNIGTTVQTLFFDPVGRPNLRNNLFKQIEVYDKYDGSGDMRRQAAIGAAIEIPSYLIGGGVAGVGTRVAQTALTKIGATKLGGAAVRAATTPISKTVEITPAAAAANTITSVYLADTGYRIFSQPTTEGKISTAANVALKEIPAGAVGAVTGYRATAKFIDGLKTLGKTEIPAERVTAPGIPLGNFNEAQLAESFNKNILSPQPNKFARATSEIGKDTAETVSAKLNPSDDVIELYHATASGSNFGKKFTVKESESEFGGLFTAPKGISYFLGDSVNEVKVSPAFFIRDFRPAESPALLNIKSRGVKPVDWQKAADSVGRSVQQVKNNPRVRKTAVDNFLVSAESQNPGYAYMPMIKREYEAVIPQGTQLKRTRSRYYTRINNTRVPIYEYEPVGFTAGRETATRPRRLSSSSSAELRSSSRNYVPAGSPVSLYSGSTRSSSAGGKSSIRDSFLAQLSEISRDSPQKTTKTAYTATQTNYNSPVKTTTRGNSLYSNITANKATPQKITPIDTNYLSRKSNQLIKRQKKPTDERKETEKLYSAVRTGRIDHLSIKDPLEFYGTGKSITDRKRPDRVLNKQALYFVDNAISTRRPTGRRKVKP